MLKAKDNSSEETNYLLSSKKNREHLLKSLKSARNKKLLEQIKNYPHPLYYNTSGNPTAYKLGIKHILASVNDGLAIKAGEYLYPKDELHIVDFENEEILVVKDKIKYISLESLN